MKLYIKVIYLVSGILCIVMPVFSSNVIQLPDVIDPVGIIINNGKIFISEKNNIKIYSLESFKLLKTFGSIGQGPGEFISPPVLNIYSDFILLNCSDKIMFFSLDGKYISERRSVAHNSLVLPIGEGYVAREPFIKPKQTRGEHRIGLYNKNLEFQKEIYRGLNTEFSILTKGSNGKENFEVLHHFFRYETYKNRIYIADSTKGFFFSVFDSSGKHLFNIEKDIKKTEVTKYFKTKTLKKIDQTPWLKKIKNRFNFKFKKYFPQIRHFSISNEMIYVSTYIENYTKQQILILDLNGVHRKVVMVPKHGVNRNNKHPLYNISDHKYYFLRESEITENWELGIMSI